MINLALIGYGNWGPKLFRNFITNAKFKLIALAEKDLAKQKEVKKLYPDVKIYDDGIDVIVNPSIDAVVIACPVKFHYSLAKKALLEGKHVLVEKPMCENQSQAKELIELANQKNLTLMVDHTLLFTGAVKKIKQLCHEKQLGDISYFDATRVNLGMFQPDVSVLWDLGPHDLAVMDYIFDEEPSHIEASGFCHVNRQLNDMAFITLYFPSKKIAHFKFSWMSPVMIRQTIIGGSKKMLVWNDLNPDQKLKIYDTKIIINPKDNKDNKDKIIMPRYSTGDVLSPKIDLEGALVGVTHHFADVIMGREKSLMDGVKGLRILKILEIAEQKINNNLKNTTPFY
ncbi:MAG: Gfo/Idh/MocA family oxidoreductase [SAR324 cluster bacterium]|nr:Gfo/Idh/MocA family oxidoreductase [SAR324 cluster bacterium]